MSTSERNDVLFVEVSSLFNVVVFVLLLSLLLVSVGEMICDEEEEEVWFMYSWRM